MRDAHRKRRILETSHAHSLLLLLLLPTILSILLAPITVSSFTSHPLLKRASSKAHRQRRSQKNHNKISLSIRTTTASFSSELGYVPTNQPSISSPRRNDNKPPPRPFIIERISDCQAASIGNDNKFGDDSVFREIADVCIDVFFKEQLNAAPEDRIPPWKDAQISYLKSLQTADLRRRRDRYSVTNEMYLAFSAEPALTESSSMSGRLIMDNGQIQNLPSYVADQPFVRGDLLGFVEITQRPYGLGEGMNIESDHVRPILTNLAVSRKARTLGIGSKLLDQCERHVARNWQMNEIVLEVEDYNTNALDFYTKRGYEVLYADPASRRFDVSGFVLKKVRCTRQILRKELTWQMAQAAGDAVASRNWFAQFVQGVR